MHQQSFEMWICLLLVTEFDCHQVTLCGWQDVKIQFLTNSAYEVTSGSAQALADPVWFLGSSLYQLLYWIVTRHHHPLTPQNNNKAGFSLFWNILKRKETVCNTSSTGNTRFIPHVPDIGHCIHFVVVFAYFCFLFLAFVLFFSFYWSQYYCDHFFSPFKICVCSIDSVDLTSERVYIYIYQKSFEIGICFWQSLIVQKSLLTCANDRF